MLQNNRLKGSEGKLSLRSIIGRILFSFVLVAVALFVIKNLNSIRGYKFSPDFILLLLAFILISLSMMIRLFLWSDITRSFKMKAPFSLVGMGFFLSLLGKYIPGKIALVLIRTEVYKGYSRKRTGIAMLIEYVAGFAGTFLLVLTALMFNDTLIPQFIKPMAAVVTVILLVILHPAILTRLVNSALKVLKRSPVERTPAFSRILAYTGGYFIANLIGGSGFFLVINSFATLEPTWFLVTTGVYYSASIAGLLAVFSPGGIGIREGVLFLILPALLPEPVVIVSALVMRVMITLSELALAGIFSIAARTSKPISIEGTKNQNHTLDSDPAIKKVE